MAVKLPRLVPLTKDIAAAIEQREPLWVRCEACAHCWIGMYLPLPIADAAKVMGKLCCPMCAADAKRIAPTKIVSISCAPHDADQPIVVTA